VKSFRVVYLGTPQFAVEPLKVLLDHPKIEIVKVITQPDRPAGRKMKLCPSPVKVFCQDEGVPFETIENVNEESVIEGLKALNADVGMIVAFGQILRKNFLELFPKGVVNIHGSLLPRWRGAAPIQRALMEGDLETGVSLQKVVRKLDAGDVVGKVAIRIREDHNSATLFEELTHLCCQLVREDFVKYLEGEITPEPQDESMVTIAQKILKEEGLIDWSRPAREIHNRIRGLWGWPGSWTVRDGKPLKVFRCEFEESDRGAPGEVIEVGKESLLVACKEGALRIFEVQPPNKAQLSVETYLCGYPVKEGERFG
jgi:methionyl-tRNA formyltransferase